MASSPEVLVRYTFAFKDLNPSQMVTLAIIASATSDFPHLNSADAIIVVREQESWGAD